MIRTPIVTFDIETIPDPAALRAAGLADPELDEAAAVLQAQARRLEKTGSDFLPVHCQRVLVISCTFRNHEGLKIHSFVDQGGQEGQVVQSFFRVIEKHAPQLVSWNGGGFDLPVLHYRGLVHGVMAPKYWDMGEDDREMKWNNYISRYHTRHLDLMDLLALYQPRANAPMDVLAKLCGFPGKLGMDGSKVFDAWLAGQTDDIRRYCETDVMNTYLLYCRFQLMRGALSASEYADEIDLVRHTLGTLAAQESHWQEYLAAWPEQAAAREG
ncbi:MAG: 3'-5' exonuclease [Thiomonas sp. 20-64-9]|jgi:predicted PolB exonuclease-like 3'-5' exonuclease|uniref:3'-5' exonuclease n=1 Tax=unclassified Thiomonas TaxID=2625466 RepID=UPI000B2420D0|nr:MULTISPECIES: 3'-5' exonuclease [unclassified Thiomonas]OYV31382.1 MAG: 3'-5' exonuclease [Thiomonas sp. 20-64-9]OZB69908.1 MAG: 3'-5' exonuclease [Thiomonas sp. 13-64-67]